MFAARLDAAAANQPSPMFTPVINLNPEVPGINKERGRDIDTSGMRPRKLTRDIWFYVHELGCVIGRVKDKKSVSGSFKVTLDNDMVFIVNDTTIIRGRYMKRSLSGNTFRFHHM